MFSLNTLYNTFYKIVVFFFDMSKMFGKHRVCSVDVHILKTREDTWKRESSAVLVKLGNETNAAVDSQKQVDGFSD